MAKGKRGAKKKDEEEGGAAEGGAEETTKETTKETTAAVAVAAAAEGATDGTAGAAAGAAAAGTAGTATTDGAAGGEETAAEEPKAKKSKKAAKGGPKEYKFNVNKALDKAHEGKRFSEVIQLPPSSLEGISPHSDPMFKSLRINTIQDLGNWKHFKVSRALAALANTEEKDKRAANSVMNINKCIDKEHHTKTLGELVAAPVSALNGLAEWSDEALGKMKIKSIKDLAGWKYPIYAEAMNVLAEFEA